MSNARKVSTDALETLGQIIDETQKRDAIHITAEKAPEEKRGNFFTCSC